MMGVRMTYRACQRRQVQCLECNVDMAEESLNPNHNNIHGVSGYIPNSTPHAPCSKGIDLTGLIPTEGD